MKIIVELDSPADLFFEENIQEILQKFKEYPGFIRLTLDSTQEREDVKAFQLKFNVPMSHKPVFLTDSAFDFRVQFLKEELEEFRHAHLTRDMHGAADALVDLAYVLHGTALMMGLPWRKLWDEVQRANMEKIRATDASQSKRGSALDVIKPAGWVGPDHSEALGAGPWGTLI